MNVLFQCDKNWVKGSLVQVTRKLKEDNGKQTKTKRLALRQQSGWSQSVSK